MGRFPLMFIYCILYHFWGVRRILLPPPRQFRTPLATARPLATLLNTMGSAPMVKKTLSRYALAPWGMQPNTSLAALLPRFPWAFPCSCLCAYYTIFGNFWVTSRGRRSGKKSIFRAPASFAAVRKVMLTSCRIIIFRWRWKVEVDSGCLNFFL